jgi:hypothetical protein
LGKSATGAGFDSCCHPVSSLTQTLEAQIYLKQEAIPTKKLLFLSLQNTPKGEVKIADRQC